MSPFLFWHAGSRSKGGLLYCCDWRRPAQQPISPLEGEMPGRAEGGPRIRLRRRLPCNERRWRSNARRPPLSPSATSPPQGGRSAAPAPALGHPCVNLIRVADGR
ncbi:MAG: hypothetical protein E5X33_23345 [Mesorhizobium sp.]|nr:MAG: hypothetical protein EOQ76_11385 [Mesorhizobium sp.]RWH35950.1 MAG: hypothetical protein EOQ79_19560 [Mesorhizobium sp.]RWI93494.1 MAG: hypothetical protein EOR22_15705 [Mesorhizobium sp.]TIQ05770.1 MAG: hypothetical protein E5X50_19985 [Mesorhizobium sp.]TIR18410.1 MAG: hypothetical protein E5X33_23345 [Mesorhizobium sp.]